MRKNPAKKPVKKTSPAAAAAKNQPARGRQAEKWFYERHQGLTAMGFKYKKILFEGQSKFQNVKIIETWGHGRMLINDGIIMTCERDEFIYHEMLAHVPMSCHPRPENVLIIGGGDGGTAREALKRRGLKRCVMAEIDSMVVSACRKHLRGAAAALDHPLLELRLEDGAEYVANCPEGSFDVALVDSSDPVGPSSVLFGERFYRNLRRALKPDGIVAAQGGSPFYELDFQKKFLRMAHNLFPKTGFYSYSNLSYPGGRWSFLFASKGPRPIKDLRAPRLKGKLKYYNSETHRAAFARPQFAKRAFGSSWTL